VRGRVVFEDHRNQPWLAREDWASRRLVSEQSALATVFFSGFLLVFFAIIAVLLVLLGRHLEVESGMVHGQVWGFVAAGLLTAAAIHTLVSRVRSHGTAWSRVKFSCRLETLPGVIGGWFKAQVEADLPAAPESASVRLAFLEGETEGGAPTGIWSVVYDLGNSDLITIGDGRFRIPVRFQIPRRLAEFTDRPRWVLTTSVKLSRQTSHKGSFVVPIYRTALAPEGEQQPEQPFAVREETGGSRVFRLLGPRRL
jgi:hypothetical protein